MWLTAYTMCLGIAESKVIVLGYDQTDVIDTWQVVERDWLEQRGNCPWATRSALGRREYFELTGERSVGTGKLLGRILDQHPRPALFVAGSPVRVIVDASARPENFCTTTPVLPAVSPEVPLGDARYRRNLRDADSGWPGGETVPRGPGLRLSHPARRITVSNR